MNLARSDFAAFFAALHDGHRPFDWQERLLDEVVSVGWPDAVVAPTGAGKTAAIDVHVFALALAAASGTPPPPRRLAMVVGRRVLVDDQYEYARALADLLRAPEDDIVTEVARLLWSVQTADRAGGEHSPLLVVRLRGGEPPSRRWVDHPTAAAVLCATPEMWGSRLLFRGYGSRSTAWPREAGLLAFDTVAVVDEAHLSRQVLTTARRVGELAIVADEKWDGPAPLQVVETTATPGEGAVRRAGVEESDLGEGSALAARLRRPKPVTLVPCADWTAARPTATVPELVRRTLDLRDRTSGTVGCFVNTVARAVAVAGALSDRKATGRDLTVVLVCGRTRPIDIARLEATYPGLLGPAGNDEVHVLVSTQSLEVGVDLDLAGIVTELAPVSALAQRAGRVNRLGRRADGPVVVTVPEADPKPGTRHGPYVAEDLAAGLSWLRGRAADPSGLAPWALVGHPPPAAARCRTLLQRPELGQVWHWARTTDDLAARPEVELWLAEDHEPETTVGIVVRRSMPTEPAEAVALVSVLPPRRHEAFPTSLGSARAVLTALRPSGVRVRGGEITPLGWRSDGQPDVRPGDIVVVDDGVAMFTAAGPDGHPSPQVVVPDTSFRMHTAPDGLEVLPPGADPRRPGVLVHRVDLVEEFAGLVPALDLDDREDDAQSAVREVVRERLSGEPGTAGRAAELIGGAAAKDVDVVVQRDGADLPVRVIVVDRRRAAADEYVRQEWTPNPRAVPLDRHQDAVARRAVAIGRHVGLSEGRVGALRDAALHHDDGKADIRFQARLGRSTGPLRAKSAAASPDTNRRRADRCGLPPGWRHEQRSVVDALLAIGSDADHDLVARLVGTTHGYGRVGFPHTAAELLTGDAADEVRELAEALFDEGGWDELVEGTERRIGVWGCAYLEALLRAADGQVSEEGS